MTLVRRNLLVLTGVRCKRDPVQNNFKSHAVSFLFIDVQNARTEFL